VQNGDALGSIATQGYSGAAAAFVSAASIRFAVDGDPDTAGDTTDMPGRIEFMTNAEGQGSANPAVKMTLKNNGRFGIGVVPSFAHAEIKTGVASDVGLSVDTVPSPTAHLFSLKNNTAEKFAIAPTGDIYTAAALATSAANDQPSATAPYRLPIYNIAGTLLGYVPIYSSWS
jgi:hypothetical protein